MAWKLRPKEEAELFKPYECPQYTDAELFTIKLYYDGEMLDNPKRYIGGKFVYVDFCDPDTMSLLEITSMLVESGAEGDFYEIWYTRNGAATADRQASSWHPSKLNLWICSSA